MVLIAGMDIAPTRLKVEVIPKGMSCRAQRSILQKNGINAAKK
jgi:hypothetical protein